MKKNPWKEIKIEGSVLTDSGNLEGLIGIQELTDYEPDVVSKGHKRSNGQILGAQSKNSKANGEPSKKRVKTEKKATNVGNGESKVKKLKNEKNGEHVLKVSKTSSTKSNGELKTKKKHTTDTNEEPKIKKPKMQKRAMTEANDKLKIIKSKLEKKIKSEPINEPKIKILRNENKPKKVSVVNGFLVEELQEKVTPDTTICDSNVSDIEDSVTKDELIGWNGLELSDEILQALCDLKFVAPTPIQALTLPPAILGRRDILGAAETGSGKTLAFGIPIIHGILKLKQKLNAVLHKNTSRPLYALILTPTRELAVQVKNHLVALAKHTDIRIAVILGGMAAVKQERILKYCPEIVVATPGRLWELIQEHNEHLSKVDSIRFLAIDETDRMVERGHFNELQLLLERINADESLARKRQNFVFSATLTLVHDLPKHLILKKKKGAKILNQTPGQKLQHLIQLLGINNPKIVDVTHETGMAKSLTECRISCAMEHKDYYLYYLLKRHPGRTLVFCNSISCVRRLTQLFTILQCNPLPLHASMQQRQRLKNLERFRDNADAVLVSTDVAARGLDIPDVQHVIHYQVPRSSENYVHRSGRTARASKQGITILLMEPAESKNYAKLCRTLGKVEDLPLFPIEDAILSAMKKRVNLAREIDSLELQVRRTNAHSSWFEKNAEEMDILLDKQDSDDDDENRKITSNNKRSLNVKKKQLSSLLSQPLLPRGFSSRFPTCNGVARFPHIEGEQSKEDAVEIMKKAIENYKNIGKKPVKVLKLIKD
ncbi:DEAD-box ATP-dependent RNA helicase 13 [Ctenocephalides felis]|uniref:DEAD-box ATP-dependent RNA helicase 13 n=1 Tax=Ctenocephalides felis TaxID=7515 RepID=UPI000E6E23A4|nr:DEAD-box ATP-dependent RNA helicase 13 [Ctenocephalides felis]XP_026476871.1 DEAD-box ATP-dependent RNA helicase 13 [Ctenocephalides felis]